MSDKKRVPKLRFPGFTEPWEQRKLGEIANKVTTKNKDTQYVETFTNSAELGIISQRDFFDHDVSNMDNISGYYVVDDDAFVYNPRISTSAPVGPINRNKLGRTGVMSPLYTVFKTHSVYSEYLEWFFKSTRWHSFMKFNGDSGARSDRFSIKDAVFFEMPIPIPDIEEQKKIGQYLSTLENLITLHQRKLEHVKKMKKSMLQKMFPKKNQLYPEVRFPEFTDVWEQRKLGELGEIMTGSTPSTSNSEYYSEDGIPWVTPTDINSQTISDTPRKLSEEGMKVGRVVPANTILCTCIASIGKNTLLTVKGSFNQQINCLTPNEYNDAYFLLTESVFWSNIMKRMAAAGTMQIVNKTEFSELTTMVPKLEEQKKIGQYFRALDHLITLHQRELDHLQLLKKGMLQQMFI